MKAVEQPSNAALHPLHVHTRTFVHEFLLIANFKKFSAVMKVQLIMLFAGSIHDHSVRLRERAHCIADTGCEREGSERILFERLADPRISGSEQHDLPA